jgi:thymidylate synthase (FAD)
MPRFVEPEVFLIAQPEVDYDEVARYLELVGGGDWMDTLDEFGPHAEDLVEFGGRLCYRSFEPGLNPNVTKVRTDKVDYFKNILKSGHGSVVEHANFSFALHNVSRVFTHELVRHRAGCAISQESMRFVRLTDIPFWLPQWAKDDPALYEESLQVLHMLEKHQKWMAEHFKLDDDGVPFHEKKAKTSFMRRFAPDGVATSLLWTANIRTLRHVIEVRTAAGAEEEIRLVFDTIAEAMKTEVPKLMQDFTREENGEWIPAHRKV